MLALQFITKMAVYKHHSENIRKGASGALKV